MLVVMSAYFAGFLFGSRLAPEMIRRVHICWSAAPMAVEFAQEFAIETAQDAEDAAKSASI